jgi:hypothetical protein
MKIGLLEDQKSPKNAKMGIFGLQGDTKCTYAGFHNY